MGGRWNTPPQVAIRDILHSEGLEKDISPEKIIC